MIMQDRATSFLSGANASYLEDLYEKYLGDATAVPEEWRSYFDVLRQSPAANGTGRGDIAHGPIVMHFLDLAKRSRVPKLATNYGSEMVRKQVAVQSLIAAYRMVGARSANLDPLNLAIPAGVPELNPEYHGLSSADLTVKFSTIGSQLFVHDVPLRDIVDALRNTYCGTLAVEFFHLTDPVQRQWWESRLEVTRAKPALSSEKKLRIIERLTAAEGLEKYLNTRYAGQKRFSVEGSESLIVLLDEAIQYGSSRGVRSVVMGMAHRGRLNVLVNTVGKPAYKLFEEFDGLDSEDLLSGDVKYHKGYSETTQTPYGEVEVVLASNPSHLEIINPVVQGMARAKAEQASGIDSVLAVEVHGDASMSGQGIVMETLSLTYTRGFGTRGSLHIVVNNQIGFTTSDPRDMRSSFFCTDVVKMIEAPVLHVNGDDVEAVVMATQLALDYRSQFKRSVVIDLVCFRRHGHQEQDTPGITQPAMYKAISDHPGIRDLYAKRLFGEGVLTAELADDLAATYRLTLETSSEAASSSQTNYPVSATPRHRSSPARNDSQSADDAFPIADLRAIAKSISTVPSGFMLHPLVQKMMTSRGEMAAGIRPVDWGMGEHLAFASLLVQGFDVRLSGQDSIRGTFNHRHAALQNFLAAEKDEDGYVPLHHIGPPQGRFTIINSLLSEAAVLAFEYGYSSVRRDTLVIWEAQFGDFANGAQVVTDQFIASGAGKWGQRSGVVMFLPHGQEGQGPEHASARLERYLQLCAECNMQVCQPTTPAQFFHLLRRQTLADEYRPLIVLTPKSLLRHPKAVNQLEDFTTGSFRELILDSDVEASSALNIDKVIICSGKVYYELLEHRRVHGLSSVSLIRIEQLYPFPSSPLSIELARFPNLRKVVWCQEEPHNQGAWGAMEPILRKIVPSVAELSYVGPPASASTAPGHFSVHVARQKELVLNAFAGGEVPYHRRETLDPECLE